MKKLALTLAIVLGLGMTTFADGGGLFQRGNTPEQENAYFKTETVLAVSLEFLATVSLKTKTLLWAQASSCWSVSALPTS